MLAELTIWEPLLEGFRNAKDDDDHHTDDGKIDDGNHDADAGGADHTRTPLGRFINDKDDDDHVDDGRIDDGNHDDNAGGEQHLDGCPNHGHHNDVAIE